MAPLSVSAALVLYHWKWKGLLWTLGYKCETFSRSPKYLFKNLHSMPTSTALDWINWPVPHFKSLYGVMIKQHFSRNLKLLTVSKAAKANDLACKNCRMINQAWEERVCLRYHHCLHFPSFVRVSETAELNLLLQRHGVGSLKILLMGYHHSEITVLLHKQSVQQAFRCFY